MDEENGKKALMTADEVARELGLRPTTIYQWCREGRLPAIKLGKEWRIRRTALNAFLEQSERRPTLVGQLRAFLTVPDHVLGIAEDKTLLHRLDAAYFQVGEARGALLVKFTDGEAVSTDMLRNELERYGLAARRLEAEGRMRFIPEADPLGDRGGALRAFVEAANHDGLIWASFNWTERVDLETTLRQEDAISTVVDNRPLVVKTALLQAVTDDWPPPAQRRAQDTHAGVIWLSERGLGLRRIVPLPPG
ncbi:MAG: helix-turn-helix domain-containing protein [Thermomicrobia bacterium]|nr:helix-turn-helix domain-containing protein [Thermomicrobia bacterium]